MNTSLPSASQAMDHAIAAIDAAPVREEPFPHIYVEGVFPASFYDAILANLPEENGYTALVETGRVGAGYSPERLVVIPAEAGALGPVHGVFWSQLFAALLTEALARAMMTKFDAQVQQRFLEESGGAGMSLDLHWESLLVRDRSTYLLGPHTDSPRKVLSALFYLPADASRPELGTALYAPKTPGFTCPGGPHHPHDQFACIRTMAYKPNTLFAFPKSKRCFHGVEPVVAGMARDLLFYDLYRQL